MKINAKDLASGVILIVIAVVGLWLNTDHAMGPGYMPWLVFMLQLVLGAVVLAMALFNGPDPLEGWAWRELALVLLSMCVFALLLERGGLFLAIAATVAVSAVADRTQRALGVLGLIVFLIALCWWIFIKQLDIRVNIWPQF